MADEILPHIEREDYAAFQRTIKQNWPGSYSEWPDTYEGWLKIDEREKLTLRQKGHTIRSIKVLPNEFTTFCQTLGLTGTLQNLWRFSIEEDAKRDAASNANVDTDFPEE